MKVGHRHQQGVTLVEILVASVIGALLAGGTMMAFVMSRKVTTNAAGTVEAAELAQQTLERFRNQIACDLPWFNGANCASGAALPTSWTTDTIPASSSLPVQGGTRQYKVSPADCDGDGTPGDCFRVDSKVTWSPPQ